MLLESVKVCGVDPEIDIVTNGGYLLSLPVAKRWLPHWQVRILNIIQMSTSGFYYFANTSQLTCTFLHKLYFYLQVEIV